MPALPVAGGVERLVRGGVSWDEQRAAAGCSGRRARETDKTVQWYGHNADTAAGAAGKERRGLARSRRQGGRHTHGSGGGLPYGAAARPGTRQARQANRLHRLVLGGSCRHASIQSAATSRAQVGPRRGQAARDRLQAAYASARHAAGCIRISASGRGRAAGRGRQPQGSKHRRQLTCQGASPTG
jgi:hypothetical protein